MRSRSALVRLTGLAVLLVVTACGALGSSTDDPSATPTSEPRAFDCALLDQGLAERATGATEVESRGESSGSIESGDYKARCSITDGGGSTGQLTVLATSVDPAEMTEQIRDEATTRRLDCSATEDAVGASAAYSCTSATKVVYDGVWGEHLVRVVLTPPDNDGRSESAYTAAREVALSIGKTLDRP